MAFTMLCLAWTVGGTEGKKGCQRGLGKPERIQWLGEEALSGDPESEGQGLGKLQSFSVRGLNAGVH